MSKIALRNNVKVLGYGNQPLMFAHGFGCDQNMWRFIYPAFMKDYKIILFDYVGSGKSDINAYNVERYSDLNGYAEDILEIIDEFELTNVILAGHSVSSMVAALAAIRRPQAFERLVFIGPSPRYINDNDYYGGFEKKDIQDLLNTMETNYIGWANFLGPSIMKNPERPELSRELTESFCSTDPLIARKFAEVTFFSDNRADLPKVKVPVLVMQCSDDIIAPVEVGKYVHENTPVSALSMLQATGHCPHMSAPEETIAVIKEYLNIPVA